MRLRILIGFLVSIMGPPVQAGEWLVQQPGDSRPTMIFKGASAPVPGVTCPAGSLIAPFVPVDGDAHPGHYEISGDVAAHNPPPPPAPPVPDPNAPQVEPFKSAVFQDQAIALEARLELAKCFPVFDAYATKNPVLLAQYWAGMKTATMYPWLTQSVIESVEAHAATYHIPLVPPQ